MGLVIFAAALFLLITGKADLLTFVTMTVLAWVFLTAKDALLEEITAGLFKVDVPDQGSAKINLGAQEVAQGIQQITQGIQEVKASVQAATQGVPGAQGSQGAQSAQRP